ncbi:winged helix-turn-helix domain-containing protein [Cellulomonas sp. APG4]|uniref:winged helix-turn-helix domain-containing protein n=1 Tax=Cellulomonas sp. APG4 TaxID=1538656 RepID=UPI00137A7191|nr:crosslink repair DNA glycosylase YcaQ family protein [Cellulomonas sp. APG4]NCT91369.1 winged helix-turn-helix domain-containing protein [Cellulomonas sp. APG4]
MPTSPPRADAGSPGARTTDLARAPRSGAPRAVTELSLAQARRVALRAQGLDRRRVSRSAPVTMRQLQQVIDRLGLFQIDSVNVLARAHLMPTWSRLGDYDVGLLDRASGRSPRRLVEAWAHEASFIPPETYPLLAWRRRDHERHWSTLPAEAGHGAVIDEVRALLRTAGPMTAREVHAALEVEHPRTRTDWGWNWTVAKRVLEHLFFTGEISSAGRTPSFERAYDLTSRVLPPAVLAQPAVSDADAVRGLIEIGARAHGIGTERCFADYFRVRGPAVRGAVTDLVDDGVLVPVRVRGWDRPTYLHRDAHLPRRATGRALLSPFDPLVFERRRLLELFGLHYRIEIYTPADQRVYGYYVLPFLLGDTFVARVDLKADRRAGALLVQAAHAEEGAPVETADELADELGDLARWLGLDQVVVPDGARGALAGSLVGLAGVRAESSSPAP